MQTLYKWIERDVRYKMPPSRLGVPILWGFCLIISCFFVNCRKSDKIPADGPPLVIMGDSILRVEDVVRRIPVGIEKADSLELFRQIVDNWIETMVLKDMAQRKLPDLPEIERKVEQYRNRLIVMEYLSKMKERHPIKVDPDSVRIFYDNHKNEMISETPLVKGIFLQVPEDIPGIQDIRTCIYNGDDNSIDELETNYIADALQYEYFQNNWVDWSTLQDLIPYRFHSPGRFLETTSNFETSHNGSVYFLHISEYLPAGSQIPFEFASSRITAILEQSQMANYEKELKQSLINKAQKEGRLVRYDEEAAESYRNN